MEVFEFLVFRMHCQAVTSQSWILGSQSGEVALPGGPALWDSLSVHCISVDIINSALMPFPWPPYITSQV